LSDPIFELVSASPEFPLVEKREPLQCYDLGRHKDAYAYS